jgi:hypothetical protein
VLLALAVMLFEVAVHAQEDALIQFGAEKVQLRVGCRRT